MLYIVLGVICLIGYIALKIAKSRHNSSIVSKVDAAIEANRIQPEEREATIAEYPFSVPDMAGKGLIIAMLVFVALGSFNGLLFMQEPRESTYVRDVSGSTHVNFKQGWHLRGFGTIQSYKKETSAAFGEPRNGQPVSFQLPAKEAYFLDNVSAKISATVRIKMPTDKANFDKMHKAFGSTENMMASLMIPLIERTIDATTGLMTAEKYFSGGKTEFMNEFDVQMRRGLYVVDLVETKEANVNQRKASQNASKGTEQDAFGDTDRIVYKVVKRLDGNNQPILTPQEYAKYGITIQSAIITEMDPNTEFDDRMKLKQKASADLAIAREDTKKEEALKLKVIAAGERMAAEAQAVELLDQVTRTTKAETERQIAITTANQNKDSMTIEEETAKIQLRRDKLSAKSIVALADANAYDKKITIEADGALGLKLKTYEAVMDRMATAIEKRQVPTTLINMGASGSSNGTGNDLAGSSSDIGALMQIIAADSAKSLALDMTMKAGAKTQQ